MAPTHAAVGPATADCVQPSEWQANLLYTTSICYNNSVEQLSQSVAVCNISSRRCFPSCRRCVACRAWAAVAGRSGRRFHQLGQRLRLCLLCQLLPARGWGRGAMGLARGGHARRCVCGWGDERSLLPLWTTASCPPAPAHPPPTAHPSPAPVLRPPRCVRHQAVEEGVELLLGQAPGGVWIQLALQLSGLGAAMLQVTPREGHKLLAADRPVSKMVRE